MIENRLPFIGKFRRQATTGRILLVLLATIFLLFALEVYGLISGHTLLGYVASLLVSFALGLAAVVFFVRADLMLPLEEWEARGFPRSWRNRGATSASLRWIMGCVCLLCAVGFLPQGLLPLAFPALSLDLRFFIIQVVVIAMLLIFSIGSAISALYWLRKRSQTNAMPQIGMPASAPLPHVSRRTLLIGAGVVGLEVFGVGWLISRLPAWIPRQSFRVANGISAHGIAWAPDGRRLAGLLSKNVVAIWDGATGATLKTLAARFISSAAWAPDGSQIAMCGVVDQSQAVRVWDSATGQILLTRNLPSSLQGEDSATLLWRENRLFLMASSSNVTSNGYGVYVWEVFSNTYRRIFTLQSVPDTLVLSPTASHLVGYDLLGGSLTLWEVATGVSVSTLRLPQNSELDGIQTLAWSPDGQRIAIGMAYNRAIIVDALTGDHRQTLQGPLDSYNQFPDSTIINSVAWSPDGEYLAAASMDTTVRIWRVPPDNQPQTTFVWAGHFGGVESVVWSPTGKLIASESSGSVQVWSPSGDLWQAE